MTDTLSLAPGSVVLVRDEEWLVSSAEQAADGLVVRVLGLSELVRGTTATFYEALDDIRTLDPHAPTWSRTAPRTTDARGCGWRRRCARPASR